MVCTIFFVFEVLVSFSAFLPRMYVAVEIGNEIFGATIIPWPTNSWGGGRGQIYINIQSRERERERELDRDHYQRQ